ncbi:hypothetical protein OCL06_09445 [Alteromonas sp. ASW11-19]|uniref:DUF2570 domain-containing protein n=1 Tax=Alteromonas salexigens TaxID=2982530 RepID=A0ABT2VNE8_9ALTE|nr:hypothetical protein [Alteromonas salexigens]MCU7554823.1 hypothetical protein [Alteromonas salexigens]
MIIILGSVVAGLVILLTFLIVRGQNMQRELALTRHSAKTHATKVRYAFTSLVVVTNNLQQIFISRVERAHQKKLINEEDYAAARALANQYSRIMMDCCEKGATVEEAVKKSMQPYQISMLDLKNLIKNQPNDVRVSWTKNTPDGFTAAMNNLTNYINGDHKKAEEDQASEIRAS